MQSSAIKVQELKNWLVPHLETYAMQVTKKVLSGAIRAGEKESEIKPKLGIEAAAEMLAKDLFNAVRELKF